VALRPEVFYRLALCHFGREEFEEARACLRVTIGLRPRWISPLTLLAAIGFRKPDPALVDEVLRTLESGFPDNDQALVLRATCLQFRGDAKGASDLLSRVKEDAPIYRAQSAMAEAQLEE